MSDHDAHWWSAVEDAVELLHEGAHDDALASLRATLDGDPTNPYAHFFLGAVLVEQGRHGPALMAFSEAERRKPEYLGAVVARGWCLYELARFAEAVRAGHRALELCAEHPDALDLLATSHAELGEPHVAVGYLERFLKTKPTPEARFEAEAMLQALRGRAHPLDDT
jgi:cytochrome c-type biogenesis protein CcmH/NrfG